MPHSALERGIIGTINVGRVTSGDVLEQASFAVAHH
jgi:hypothetical protein